MTPSPAPAHEFGPFRYDSAQRLLFRSGEKVNLPPKTLDLLHVLLEHRGTVVSKADLMRLVWPDAVVEEIGLARNVSLLRKALEEEPGAGPFIETIPKRGYRFLAPAAAAVSEPAAKPVRARRRRWLLLVSGALAVALAGLVYWQFYVPSRFLVRNPNAAALALVPFETLVSEPWPGGFSRGLDDLLLTRLSKFSHLSVMGPSTVGRYRYAGVSMGVMARLLGLEALVEGSTQRTGGRIRVSARLVDVHTGKLIWADTYEYPAADPGAAQAEAARDIAAQIGAHMAIHGQFR
jgi:DNA-binding winged helix-turn-helix (wHTH) protein/TolB-like protein